VQLTGSVVCDPSVLKHGVRRIYALDGSLVTNLDQLDEGQAFVCASTEQFHRLDYVNITRVDWVNPSRKISTPAIVKPSESYLAQFQRPHQPTRRYGIKQRSRVCLSVSPAIVKPSESYLAQFQRPHQPIHHHSSVSFKPVRCAWVNSVRPPAFELNSLDV